MTYEDGHTEIIHLSFTNEAYADQEAWNALSASLPGTFEGENPGDGLRSSMSSEEYAALMEQTDAELPGIAESNAPTESAAPEPEAVPETADAAGAEANADAGEDADMSAGADLGMD